MSTLMSSLTILTTEKTHVTKLSRLHGHNKEECLAVLTKDLSIVNPALFRCFGNNERSELTVILEKLKNFIVAAKCIEVVRNDTREKTEKNGIVRH